MTRPENSRRGGSFRIAVRSRWSSRTGYIRWKTMVSHASQLARMRRDRAPHIGEYVAKTNAICDFSPGPASLESGQ